MPPVYQYTRGNKDRLLQLAACGDSCRAALENTRLDAFAPSSRTPRQHRAHLWESVLSKAGIADPYALTPEVIFMAAGLFRAAGYRSAMEYVNQAVTTARERGRPPGEDVLRAVFMARNACKRGLGPPKRAAPLPLGGLARLPVAYEPWAPGGPVFPLRALVAGCWWLTREIELGNAACGDITVIDDATVEWNLPVSKADTRALGARRSHRCACSALSGSDALPRHLCPACVIRAQMAFRSEAPPESPLFPDPSGEFVSKKAMIATIEMAASMLGLPLSSDTGAPRWGGHALRRGGAQYLATRGVDIFRIQCLARHSSSAIVAYVEDAHAVAIADVAPEAVIHGRLRQAKSELSAILQATQDAQDRRDAAAAPLPLPASEGMTHPRGAYVVSDRGAGKMHIVDPDHPDTTACRWRFAAQKSALLTEDPATAPPCTRCVGVSLRRPGLPRLLLDEATASSSDSENSSD